MKKSHHEQRGQARVQLPHRDQVEMHWFSLDQMIRKDHLVRLVVEYVDSLDLSDLYSGIKATAGSAGRDPIDPRILFSLWLFATLEGISSGRRIADLAERDLAYMWICGNVSVNYHTVCDFRSNHGDLLDRILTDSIAVLKHHGLIEMKTIAQDGMRVRAAAGSGSFRTRGTLEESQREAEEYLAQLNESDEDGGTTKRQQSAQRRAARERLERLQQASEAMEDLHKRHAKRNQHKSDKHKRSEPRASTTDPDARRMKMGDNGFRPAMNVQFASDVETMVIVAATVTNEGSDSTLLQPMYDNVCSQYDVIPNAYLGDGGFTTKEGVTHVERNGTKFYGPLHNERKQLEEGKDPYAARKREGEEYTGFRKRMGTDEAKEIYRKRAAAAEFPNAVCRNHGLHQFRVRGLSKTRAQALLHALAANFLRFKNLTVDSPDKTTYLEVLMTN